MIVLVDTNVLPDVLMAREARVNRCGALVGRDVPQLDRSKIPDARVPPSGENATEATCRVCLLRVARLSLIAKSQSLIV